MNRWNACLGAALVATLSHAISWLPTVGETAYINLSNQTQFLGVGPMQYRKPDLTFVQGDYRTVVLINDQWILTARHNHPGPTNIGVVTIAGRTYDTSNWIQYPAGGVNTGWNGDPENGFDVAVAKLDRRCTNVLPTPILLTDTAGGQVCTFLGQGIGGPGTTGAVGSSQRRRAGTNLMELIAGQANVLYSDFDDGAVANNVLSPYTGSPATATTHEGQLCSGDSGGPVMVLDSGSWKIAAINSANGRFDSGTNYTIFGGVSVFSKVFPCTGWIASSTVIPGKVYGMVTLSGAGAGTSTDIPVTVEVRDNTTGAVVQTWPNVALAPDGRFSFVTALRGTYKLAVKGDRWIKGVSGSITITNTESGPAAVVLYPGDVNSDNRVNLTDFSQLSTAYGSTPASPNWNARADFNLDARVNLSDFSLLSSNYGKIGA